MCGHGESPLVYGPLRVQMVTESLHSGDERCAAMKFAGDEIGATVLNGDQVRACGTGRSVHKNVVWKLLERAEEVGERLVEIMQRA